MHMDAFRQSPVAPEQQGVNVVAFFAPSKASWRFSEVHGLVYGMEEFRVALQQVPLLGFSCGTQEWRIGDRPICR